MNVPRKDHSVTMAKKRMLRWTHVETTQHDRQIGLTQTHARLKTTDDIPWTSIGTTNGSWKDKMVLIDTVLK